MEFKGVLCFVVSLMCISSQGSSYRIRRRIEDIDDNDKKLNKINAVEPPEDKIWSHAIPIDYDSFWKLSPEVYEAFKNAQSELSLSTCLSFRQKDEGDDDFIYFTNEKNDCSAKNVGKIDGKNTINLGNDCNDSGLILQQIMRVLGFEHEHQRPDRDEYVEIHYENIIPCRERVSDFDRLDKTLFNLSLPYDYNSITHFFDKQYNSNGKATITSKKSNVTFQKYYHRKLSDLDKFKINFVYQCYNKYPSKFNPNP